MMQCIKCGREIAEKTAFCPWCGEKIADGHTEEDRPLYQTDVKGMFKSGTLTVYRDRVEFSTSGVQKTVFNYSAIVSVKKDPVLERILFITEDGRTESCSVNRKHIHEAFLYIEQASRLYIEERKKRLLSQGIRYSFVNSSGWGDKVLNLSDDKAEFISKSGQSEIIGFGEVKSADMSMGTLKLTLFDGKLKSFSIEKEAQDEVLSFVRNAIQPFLAKRKEDLLSRGIYFSFASSQDTGRGTLDILKDRIEFTFRPGRVETVSFQDVRAVAVSMEMLMLSLTDGTSKSFTIDRDIRDEALSFIETAIQPYVLQRTAGYDTSFGIDERIEINEDRGVFHIIRQNGSVITKECALEDLAACERLERSVSDNALIGAISGRIGALKGALDTTDKISCVGVVLTVRTGQGRQTETVRFGNFAPPLWISRTSEKYGRYLTEVTGLMDYLGSHCPACELIVPALLEAPKETAMVETLPAAKEAQAPETTDTSLPDASAEENDLLGIQKYIEGASGYINKCATPRMIAIQGNRGNGENSIIQMLSRHLEKHHGENLVRLHTWQFSQSESGEALPVLVGDRLIRQLGDSGGSRIVEVAKSIFNITASAFTQGNTDGQKLIDALSKDNSIDPLENRIKVFSELIRGKTGDLDDRVILFLDGLDMLPPAKGVELLETIRNFFFCKGCVFVTAADYDFITRGAGELYGNSPDANKEKNLFDRLFQASFRVPAPSYDIRNYVKNRLEQMELFVNAETELPLYVTLIEHSVGREPESIDRLFDAFLLLHTMAEVENHMDPVKRLMLFSLVCMQTGFHEIYDFIVQEKDSITPAFFSDLCDSRLDKWDLPEVNAEKKAEFGSFARALYAVIDTDKMGLISESECAAFTNVLALSRVTSK